MRPKGGCGRKAPWGSLQRNSSQSQKGKPCLPLKTLSWVALQVSCGAAAPASRVGGRRPWPSPSARLGSPLPSPGARRPLPSPGARRASRGAKAPALRGRRKAGPEGAKESQSKPRGKQPFSLGPPRVSSAQPRGAASSAQPRSPAGLARSEGAVPEGAKESRPRGGRREPERAKAKEPSLVADRREPWSGAPGRTCSATRAGSGRSVQTRVGQGVQKWGSG